MSKYQHRIRMQVEKFGIGKNPDLANLSFLPDRDLGLTRESLFEIFARSETRFLDQIFLQDSCKTSKLKLVARLASCESQR